MNRSFLLAVLILSSIYFACNAQDKLNLSGGFGTVDFLNLGMRLQLKQVQLGLTTGTLFSGESSFSGEIFYHFAGKSNLAIRRPWYVRSGFTFWHFKKDYTLFKALSFGLFSNEEPINVTFFDTRLGRDFNLAENFGINTDTGLAIPINDKDMQVTFATSINFYFRF